MLELGVCEKWKWKLLSCVWFFVHGILQARILEWVAVPFSRGSSQLKDQAQVSHIAGRLFTWGVTREVQEYCSARSIYSPGDLPDPGIEPGSPALQADSLSAELSRYRLKKKKANTLKPKEMTQFWRASSFSCTVATATLASLETEMVDSGF